MNPGTTINQTIYALIREHENLLAMEPKVRRSSRLYEGWHQIFEKQYSRLVRTITAVNGTQATLGWHLDHTAQPRFWSVHNFSPSLIVWLMTSYLDTSV